jgi:hypothetical protein
MLKITDKDGRVIAILNDEDDEPAFIKKDEETETSEDEKGGE